MKGLKAPSGTYRRKMESLGKRTGHYCDELHPQATGSD